MTSIENKNENDKIKNKSKITFINSEQSKLIDETLMTTYNYLTLFVNLFFIYSINL
jgi:hypothetical protein